MSAVAELGGHQLVRRGGISTAAKVGTLLLQTAHLAVLARSVDESAFTALAAGMALLVILGALAEFGLIQVSVMALADGEPEGDVVRTTLRVSVALIAGALVLAGALSALLLDGNARWCVLVLVPWFVLSRLDSAFVAAHQFHFRAARVAAAELLSRAVLLASAVPLALHGGSWSTSRELAVIGAGFALSEVVSFAVLAADVDRRHGPGATAARTLFRRALPLGVANASSLVHARSDQVILAAMGRRSGLAAYAISFRINEAMLALANAAGAVTFPALARAEPAERAPKARRFIAAGCALGAAAGGVVFLGAPLITEVIGGGRYAHATHLTRLLVPALAASMANLTVAQLVITAGGSARLVRLALGAVALNIALTLVLVATVEASGAAVATSVTETLVLLAGAAIAQRLAPGSIPWRSVLLVPAVLSAPPWLALHLWQAGDQLWATTVVLVGVGLPLAYLGRAAGLSAGAARR